MYDKIYNPNIKLEDAVALFLRTTSSSLKVERVMYAMQILMLNGVINPQVIRKFKDDLIIEIKHKKNFVEVYKEGVLISYKYDY